MADPLLTSGTASSTNPSGVLFSVDTALFSFQTDAIGEGYRRGKSANFTQTPVIGAQSSIISFANSQPLEISIDIVMIADSPDNQVTFDALFDAFLALMCPIKNGIKPPSLCYLNMSGFVEDFVCVLTNCQQVMAKERMWNLDKSEPMDGVLSLSFLEVALTSVDANTWFPGGKSTYTYQNINYST